jgi:formylglycine-generating enzyme required for sulfatase activity
MGPASGAVTSGAVTSGAVTSGAVASGAVASGAVASGAVASGAVTSGAAASGGSDDAASACGSGCLCFSTPETCPAGCYSEFTVALDGGPGPFFCSNGYGMTNNNVDAAATDRPNCLPGGLGLSDCGASGESCCMSLKVTGGTYDQTYYYPTWEEGGVEVAADAGPAGEAAPATVSSFRLDKYEVTVGRFRQFVSAWGAGWLPPQGSGKHAHLNGGQGLSDDDGNYESGWIASDDGQIAPTDTNLNCDQTAATWTASVGSRESLPINCENWWEAYAFCIWDEGFLPSAAEWEYAAAGGSEQREYPWGSADPGVANQYAIYLCDYPTIGPCTGVTNIAPVGTPTLGAGRWGQLDLAGNVEEWTLDWAGTPSMCVDCFFVPTGPGPFPSERGRGLRLRGVGVTELGPVRRGPAPAQ